MAKDQTVVCPASSASRKVSLISSPCDGVSSQDPDWAIVPLPGPEWRMTAPSPWRKWGGQRQACRTSFGIEQNLVLTHLSAVKVSSAPPWWTFVLPLGSLLGKSDTNSAVCLKDWGRVNPKPAPCVSETLRGGSRVRPVWVPCPLPSLGSHKLGCLAPAGVCLYIWTLTGDVRAVISVIYDVGNLFREETCNLNNLILPAVVAGVVQITARLGGAVE